MFFIDLLDKHVFPARAGMSLQYLNPGFHMLSVPRASGDEPVNPYALASTAWCSPRERG